MKNIKQLLIITLAVMLILPACRKGEDDPGLSLRSRDARLIGTWDINTHNHNKLRVKKSEIIQTNEIIDTTSTITIIYDGTNYTTTENVRADEGKYNQQYFELNTTVYTITLTFEEGGTFTYSKKGITIENLEDDMIRNGNWSWGNADKKKILLHLNFQGYVETYYIRELRKDVLNLERQWDDYDEFITSDPNQGITYNNIETTAHEEIYKMTKKD